MHIPLNLFLVLIVLSSCSATLFHKQRKNKHRGLFGGYFENAFGGFLRYAPDFYDVATKIIHGGGHKHHHHKGHHHHKQPYHYQPVHYQPLHDFYPHHFPQFYPHDDLHFDSHNVFAHDLYDFDHYF